MKEAKSVIILSRVETFIVQDLVMRPFFVSAVLTELYVCLAVVILYWMHTYPASKTNVFIC